MATGARMNSSIRFSELVKKSGRPQTLVLWSDPSGNAAVKKAIKENRIATVIRPPTGTRKDFGQIGFHPQPHATYLLFPKSLSQKPPARIVGLKYDLIEEPTVKKGDQARVQRKQPARPAPKTKTFVVKVRKSAMVERDLEISASSAKEARRLALDRAQEEPFDLRAAKISVRITRLRAGGSA